MRILFALALTGAFTVALWLSSQRPGPSSRATARYAFTIDEPESGKVSVALELAGLDPHTLELRGLLSDELLGVSDFRVLDPHGTPVAFECQDDDGRFTRYRLDLAGHGSSVRVEYDVRPAVYEPPGGEREFRQCGTVVPGGCSLALPQLALVPSCALPSVALEARLPEGWCEVLPLPERLELAAPDSWWDAVLVAGRYRAVARPSGAARLALFEASPEGTAEALASLLAELERMFGPPRAPLHVVQAPFADAPEPVELPGWARAAVIDLRQVDAGSLARTIRTLVPAWFARRPAELDADRSPTGWFALGLQEYLALMLPARLGLARAQAQRIERAWVQGDRRIDLESGTLVPPQERRRAAAAFLHELARSWPAGERLEDALRDYPGSGLPRFPAGERAETFTAFLEEVVRDRSRRLSFEEEWSFELAAGPSTADAAPVARILDVAFTAETRGFLESCGCKETQAGGVAQRAQGLADLRAERPGLLVFDLGNFSPLEESTARLEPLVEEQFHVFVEGLAQTGYDAVCMGPNELFSGSQWLRREGPSKLPLLGLGLRIEGLEPLPGARVIERAGLRVGFIAYTGLDEGSLAREVNEPNLAGVSLPESLEPLLAEVRRLRPEVDVLIVGGRLQPAALRALCAGGTGVDLVLLGGLTEDEKPPRIGAGFVGDTAVAVDGTTFYGFNAVRLALDRNHRPVAIDYQPRYFDQHAPAEPRVKSLIDAFNAGLAERADLVAGMKPLFPWDPWQRDDYVGAAACAACHASQHEQWSQTPHAKAMVTLAGVRRDRHPKCVQCHVVGFESTTGYRIGAPDPRFAGVQCETCHGAGGRHVEEPRAGRMRRTPPPTVCLECHDAEHSEGFEERFGQAWAAVVHGPPGQ